MVIRKSNEIPSSEITPKSVYLNRRAFMAGAAALGVAGMLEPRRAAADATKLQTVKSPLSTPGLTPTSYKDITSYNNFYEFGVEKDNPAHNAGKMKTRPWKVTVDGLQIVGVFYHDSTWEPRLQEVLQAVSLDRTRASILISHEPRHLAVAEREGISLQVSGHTHGGQMIPWTRFASRIFGRFVHGLQRFEKMLVYTSYGAGTWGPPSRVGTYAEIVLIEFE